MSNAAKVTMLLYCDLSATEQRKLETIDVDVARIVLNELGRTERAIWTTRTDNGQRFIRLCLGDRQSTVLIEITADDLATISADVVMSRLRQGCKAKPEA